MFFKILIPFTGLSPFPGVLEALARLFCWQLCLILKGCALHDTRTSRAQLPSPPDPLCLSPARQVLANAATGRMSRDRCLVRITEAMPSDAAELCHMDDNDDGGDEGAGAQPGGAM